MKALTKMIRKWSEEKDPMEISINLNEDQADTDPIMTGIMTEIETEIETDTGHHIVTTDISTETGTDHPIETTDTMTETETDPEATEIEEMINTLVINMKTMTENQNMKKKIKK